MLKYMKKFERIIIISLMVMMAVVVLLAVIELGWILGRDIITPPIIILNINELLEIFGLFMLVLIGIELLETIKTYIMKNVIHLEVVLMVAMIAIARKVIILDIKKVPSPTLMGIGVIIIALSVGYHLVKRTIRDEKKGDE
jgi:uncharacterized membrane protein (DUF373 family)